MPRIRSGRRQGGSEPAHGQDDCEREGIGGNLEVELRRAVNRQGHQRHEGAEGNSPRQRILSAIQHAKHDPGAAGTGRQEQGQTHETGIAGDLNVVIVGVLIIRFERGRAVAHECRVERPAAGAGYRKVTDQIQRRLWHGGTLLDGSAGYLRVTGQRDLLYPADHLVHPHPTADHQDVNDDQAGDQPEGGCGRAFLE